MRVIISVTLRLIYFLVPPPPFFNIAYFSFSSDIRKVYGTVVSRKDHLVRKDDGSYSVEDYSANPQDYKSVFFEKVNIEIGRIEVSSSVRNHRDLRNRDVLICRDLRNRGVLICRDLRNRGVLIYRDLRNRGVLIYRNLRNEVYSSVGI